MPKRTVKCLVPQDVQRFGVHAPTEQNVQWRGRRPRGLLAAGGLAAWSEVARMMTDTSSQSAVASAVPQPIQQAVTAVDTAVALRCLSHTIGVCEIYFAYL